MKTLIVVFFTSLPFLAVCQDSYLGYYAQNYSEAVPGPGGEPTLQKRKGPLILVYNQETTAFYSPVKGWVYFPNTAFATKIYNGTIMESYLSDETETTNRGYYDVMVFKQKAGANIEVSMPGGHTYMAEHVQVYSPNGRVNVPYISNWKALEARTKSADSLRSSKVLSAAAIAARKKHRQDSIDAAFPYNPVDLRALADTLGRSLSRTAYLKEGFRLFLDKNGIVTEVRPDDPDIDDPVHYLLMIKGELMGKQLPPYRAADGSFCPSYARITVIMSSEFTPGPHHH